MSFQITANVDASPEDLKACWDAVPTNAACMLNSLLKIDLYSKKPDQVHLDEVLEGRAFWADGELRWQWYDGFDGQCRRPYLHLIVGGRWYKGDNLSETETLRDGRYMPGPVIWEKRMVGGKDVYSVQEHTDRPPQKIHTKRWLNDQDRAYYQWCGLNGSEVCHDAT